MEFYRFESYNYPSGTYATIPEEGQYISWSDLTQDKDGDYAILDYMSYGDYIGSMLERSNCEAFLEEHESNPLIWRVTGSYSSNAVLVHIDLLKTASDLTMSELIHEYCKNGSIFDVNLLQGWKNLRYWLEHELRGDGHDEIAEIVEFLDDYPIYDENHFSSLEWDSYYDDWESDGRDDFIRGLQEKFNIPDETIDYINEMIQSHKSNDFEVVDWMDFFESLLPSGEYYIVEQAYCVYILTDNAVESCTDEQMKQFVMQACQSAAEKRWLKLQIKLF
jgi:hypothetical protein